MSPPNHVNHAKHIQDFKDKLAECTQTAVCGRPFVLVAKLQDWLRTQAKPSTTQISRQVSAAYRTRDRPNLPVSLNVFEPGSTSCLLIFCILHMIGHGDLIHTFTEEGIVDPQLPLPLDAIENIFVKSNKKHLAREFIDKQYRFCPRRFRFQYHAAWSNDMVIPICRKTPINEGGTAHIWQIEVPEEFVEERLRQESSRSRFNAASSGAEPDMVSNLCKSAQPLGLP